MELCPCGTAYSFFNFRAFNQAPASDPESSWQVRHKGKTLKALMGPAPPSRATTWNSATAAMISPPRSGSARYLYQVHLAARPEAEGLVPADARA